MVTDNQSQLETRALTAAMDHVSDGVFVLTPNANRQFVISRANRALARLLRQDLVGYTLCHVLPREQYRRLKLHINSVMNTLQPVDFETEADMGKGKVQNLRVRLMPVANGSTIEAVVGIVKVQTESVRIRKEYMGLKDRFASVFEYAPYGVVFAGTDGSPMMINRAFQKFFDRALLSMMQNNLTDFIHPDDRALFAKAFDRVIRGLRSYDGMEVRLVAPNGQELWVSISMSLAQDYAANQPYVIMQAVDISSRKQNEAELLRMATRDHLTDISNRMVFDESLKSALTNAKRYKRQGAVLLIDMDDFKSVNDTFGHKAGDTALKAVASVLKRTMRETDTIARIGGDEFAVIMEEISADAAEAKAEGLRKAIEGLTITAHGKTIGVFASVGVRVFDGEVDSCTVEDIFSGADEAMYAQKARKGERLAS